MTETIDRTPRDRTGWGAGPWDGEPDRIDICGSEQSMPLRLIQHDQWHGPLPTPDEIADEEFDRACEWEERSQ